MPLEARNRHRGGRARELVPTEQQRRTLIMRKLLTIATISTLASVGAVAAVAGSANAASGPGVITKSTASYSDPTTNSAPAHHLLQGDIVETTCWTDGEYMDESHTWFKVNRSGIAAYVHRASINPPPGLDHC
jgi:hypothetical protein